MFHAVASAWIIRSPAMPTPTSCLKIIFCVLAGFRRCRRRAGNALRCERSTHSDPAVESCDRAEFGDQIAFTTAAATGRRNPLPCADSHGGRVRGKKLVSPGCSCNLSADSGRYAAWLGAFGCEISRSRRPLLARPWRSVKTATLRSTDSALVFLHRRDAASFAVTLCCCDNGRPVADV